MSNCNYPPFFTSQVGHVFNFLQNSLPKEWSKGHTIDGLTLPCNSYKSLAQLALVLNLWESSNGINNYGIHHKVLYKQVYANYVEGERPFLTGDYIDGQMINFAQNTYLPSKKRWSAYVGYGQLEPYNNLDESKLSYYDYALNSKQIISDGVQELIDAMVAGIASCPVVSGVINTATLITAMEIAKESFNSKVELALAQEDNKGYGL